MHISIITLFPEMFEGVLNHSILKRAKEKALASYTLINLRDFGIGKHKTVDDKPYGGGVGMVLKVDVMHDAIKMAKSINPSSKIVLLDPRGTPYTQEVAEKLSTEENITLICGHYEGYDERIRNYVDMEISIGDYVLTGGEIPAMAIIDSVTRLIPGVLGKDESHMYESFSKTTSGRILEHPHYTRPEEYDNHKVPEELLSGNPKIINAQREQSARIITKDKRPDLLTD